MAIKIARKLWPSTGKDTPPSMVHVWEKRYEENADEEPDYDANCREACLAVVDALEARAVEIDAEGKVLEQIEDLRAVI